MNTTAAKQQFVYTKSNPNMSGHYYIVIVSVESGTDRVMLHSMATWGGHSYHEFQTVVQARASVRALLGMGYVRNQAKELEYAA